MAAYLTECQGSRGATGRLGGAAGGVRALVKSWTNYASIRMAAGDDGKDEITLSVGRLNDSGSSTEWRGTPTELATLLNGKKKARKS